MCHDETPPVWKDRLFLGEEIVHVSQYKLVA